jgi:integrase/recombinase XerC
VKKGGILEGRNMILANDNREERILVDPIFGDNFIQEFILQLPVKNPKTKTYYGNILTNFYLFAGREWNELSNEQSQGYLEYLKRVHTYHEISEAILKKKVKIILQFLNYLQQRNVVNIEWLRPFKEYVDHKSSSRPKNKPRMKKEKVSKAINLSETLKDFLLFLENHDYSDVAQYKKRILQFQRFLESNGENINVFWEDHKESFLFEQIGKYEKMLSTRVSREEITLATATLTLRTVQLFVKYLGSKGLISKKYSIPIFLRGRGKRANEYVPKEKIIELMNVISEYSSHVERDLSIFLIVVDTGCRPIELANVMIEDIDQVEGTISFECDKTERRKIKISREVMDVVKDYLKIRSEYDPKGVNLFVNCSGDPINSGYIYDIFYLANLKAFGESLYPVKAFRHTYITNALDEHSFERVSKAIGHKDWKSTYYYYYRSNKRLLTNTLNKSPFRNEEEYAHKNTNKR